jgi:hypothetical protein
MLYLVYFLGPLLGSAIAVGAYRLLDTPESGTDLESISDMDDASADEEDVDEEVKEAMG